MTSSHPRRPPAGCNPDFWPALWCTATGPRATVLGTLGHEALSPRRRAEHRCCRRTAALRSVLTTTALMEQGLCLGRSVVTRCAAAGYDLHCAARPEARLNTIGGCAGGTDRALQLAQTSARAAGAGDQLPACHRGDQRARRPTL